MKRRGKRRRRTDDSAISPLRAFTTLLRDVDLLDDGFSAAAYLVARLTGSQHCEIRQLDAGGNRLLLSGWHGPPVPRRGSRRSVAWEEFLWWVVRNGKAAMTNRPLTDRRFKLERGRAWEPTGIAAAPLWGPPRTLTGTLSVARSDGRPYRARDLERLRLAADYLSLRVEAHRQARIAVTDDLTQLRNARHFRETLATACAKPRAPRRALSLIAIDLDHFGRVNSKGGHEVGDQVLREVAARIRAACRSIDVPARTGGDEFEVILPGLRAPDALKVARRICRAIGGKPFATRAGPLSVTASIGVTSLRPGDDARTLRARADEAAYLVKRSSRNRVVLR